MLPPLLTLRLAALFTTAVLLAPAPTVKSTGLRPTKKVAIPESTPAVRGVVRDVTGAVPNLEGMQALTKSQAAKLLGTDVEALGETERISPASPISAHAHMRLYCPSYVHPDTSTAGFFPGDDPGCAERTGAGIRFAAKKGQRYLIDCAGTPGTAVQWRLRPSATMITSSVPNTEHPAFVFEATADGEAALDFNANTPAFTIRYCEITAAK